jgi:hypothetical protein
MNYIANNLDLRIQGVYQQLETQYLLYPPGASHHLNPFPFPIKKTPHFYPISFAQSSTLVNALTLFLVPLSIFTTTPNTIG